MWTVLRTRLAEVLRAVMPLVLLLCLLQFTLVRAPPELFLQFLAGSALTIAGMLLLFVGIDYGILPMGRFVGAELPRRGSLALMVAVAFALAFTTTLAEPDVLVLAGQVDAVDDGPLPGLAIAVVIAMGVALFVAAAVARIVLGWSMRVVLAGSYGLLIVLALAGPAHFTPLALDAGSVTTGVLSAPVILALAVGLCSVLAGRSAVSDGFGILGLASVGPVLMLLAMGLVLR
ncbi:DUF1538 domain-containing protein [Xanthobacter pseudotagetidis]|uniref:DUF1538 domain-containing protein n=1 Tax=Xanthobacter pseudotagetidis TaxID=3119911 RepID=UPI003726BD95